MSAPRRLPATLGLALILATLLSGCMRVERTFQLNGDGTGTYSLTLGFREPTPNDIASVSQNVVIPMNAFGERVHETGGSVSSYEDQGYAYWTFTRPFTSVAQANALLQEDPRQYDPKRFPVLYRDTLHVTRETRFPSTVFHISGTISLVDLLNNAQNWSDATERLTITMPNGVISSSGGVRQGDTVSYTIHYNESARVDVVGRVAGSPDAFGVAPLIVGGALGVLAVALLAVGIRLLRRPAAR